MLDNEKIANLLNVATEVDNAVTIGVVTELTRISVGGEVPNDFALLDTCLDGITSIRRALIEAFGHIPEYNGYTAVTVEDVRRNL